MRKLTVGSASALLLMTSVSHADLQPTTKDSKVSADLMALSYDEGAALRSNAASGGDVVIDTAASADPQALAADLRALGAKKVTVFGRMVSGIMPMSVISQLNGLTSLHFARPAYRATLAGSVTS